MEGLQAAGFPECIYDHGVDFSLRAGRINMRDVRIGQGLKYRACAEQSFGALKFIRVFSTRLCDSLPRNGRIHIQDEDGIRDWEPALHVGSQTRDVDAARTLISQRRIEVPIQDHDFALRQSRLNQVLNMLSSVFDEQVEFLLGRMTAAARGFPKLTAVFTVRRLA